MADPPTNKEKGVTLKTVDTGYLATAYGLPESDLKVLLADFVTQLSDPNAALAQRFITSALDKAQVCDKLKAEKRCWLIELPPELRLRIFELCFQDELEEMYHDIEAHKSFGCEGCVLRNIRAAPPLAQISQLLRTEGLRALIGITSKAHKALKAQYDDVLISDRPFRVRRQNPSDEEKMLSKKRSQLHERYETAKQTLELLQAMATDSLHLRARISMDWTALGRFFQRWSDRQR